jgi:hypothetical protein
MGYLELLRQTLTAYGLPIDIYADKAGIFFVNTKKQANWTVEELLAGHPLNETLTRGTGCLNWARPGLRGFQVGNHPVLLDPPDLG